MSVKLARALSPKTLPLVVTCFLLRFGMSFNSALGYVVAGELMGRGGASVILTFVSFLKIVFKTPASLIPA